MSGEKTVVISKKIQREKIIAMLFLLFISVAYLVCSPIGVDMDFHVLRIGELGKELGRISSFRDFPIYMYRDVYYHYGYPIPIFYCALFLYPFAFLVLCGIEALTAYNIMVLTLLWATFFICRACAFFWSQDKELAFWIAFIYAAQPYFLMDLFVKASIGEAFAFLFVPEIALGYMLIAKNGNQKESYGKGIIILALGMNGAVCSHVISTVMIVGVLTIVFIVDVIRKKEKIKLITGLGVSALLCICLSMWYILPMLEQLTKYKYHAQIGNVLSHAPQNVLALLIPMHVSIALSSIIGRSVPLSEVGGAPMIMILLVILLCVRGWLQELTKTEKKLLLLYVILDILMSIGIIWIPFEKIFGFIQFTWRVYFIAALTGTAFIIEIVKRKRTSDMYLAISIITIISGVYVLFTCFGYFFVRDTLPRITGNESLVREYKGETTDVLYIPQGIDPNSLRTRTRTVICDSEDATFEYDINEESGAIKINIIENASASNVIISTPFIMYKGYIAANEDNAAKYNVIADDEGMTSIIIPPHEVGSIIVRYVGTWIQRWSYYISLVTVVLLIFIVRRCIFK